jgi:hypothetical protein
MPQGDHAIAVEAALDPLPTSSQRTLGELSDLPRR